MAHGLNRVMLLGDLAAEPELYVTRGGVTVLNLRLATVESYRDKDEARRERTAYHQVTVLGRRADSLVKILHKGSRLFIEGSLRTTAFDGSDGQKRTRTEVVANEVLFAGEKGAEVGLQPGIVDEPQEELPWR